MLVENLIEELKKIPKGTNVLILDYKKNLGDDDGDGSSAGIYDFEIDLHELTPDELEFYNERHDTEFKPWVAFAFENPDYDEDGKLIAE